MTALPKSILKRLRIGKKPNRKPQPQRRENANLPTERQANANKSDT